MDHPFISKQVISTLPMETIQKKLSELYNKLSYAHRTGNSHLCSQIQMAIATYQEVYDRKIMEALPKPTEGNEDGEWLDIS